MPSTASLAGAAPGRIIESGHSGDRHYHSESPSTSPAPNVSAIARIATARAVRGRVSATRASGANHAGYFGWTFTTCGGAGGAAGASATLAASPGTARAAAPARLRRGRRPGTGADQPLKGVGQVGGTGEPLVRLMRHHLVHDANDLGRQVGQVLGDRHVPAADPLAQPLDRRRAGERQLPRHQVIHGAAKAVDVAPPVDLAATRLLGRHVVDGAHRDAVGRGERRRGVGLHQDAESQVQDLDLPLAAQQDVRGLDVAVNDPLVVRVSQAHGCLRGILHHLQRGDRPLLQSLSQAVARDVFHHDVQDLLELVGVEGPHHIGMIEPTHQLHLPLKPGHHPIVRGDLRGNDLERHHPIHHDMMGLVDAPHRAGADPVEDDVTADDQAIRPVIEEPLGLVGGEDLVADQPLSQVDGVERILALEHLRPDVSQLLLGEDSRAANDREQVQGDAFCRLRSLEGRHG